MDFQHAHHAVEHLVINVSAKSAGVGGATALASGVAMKTATNPEVLSLADVGVVSGIVLGVLSLAVHSVAQWRRDRREKTLFEARMRQLGGVSDE